MSEKSDRKMLNLAEAILVPPLARGQDRDAAILCGDDIVSYGQLNQRANQAGNGFRALGIGVGDRILLMVGDHPLFIYAYLGLLKIGAVPVALNLRLSSDDLAFTIRDSGSRALILDAMFLEIYHNISNQDKTSQRIILTDKVVVGYEHLPELMAKQPDELDAVLLAPDDPAFWMYSSGTTGKPKGVVHCQKSIFSSTDLFGEILDVKPGDRIFGTSKLFFAFSLAHCFLAPLQLGATIILYPGWPDTDSVLKVVERYRPTIFLSVPTFYRNMLRDAVAEREAFSQVRYYISAGEKMPRSLFDQWMEKTGRPVLEGIGATETCFLFLANRPDAFNPGTCGLPTPGTAVKIITQDGELVTTPGTPGILWVKMDSVAGGYWNMDKRTRQVFRGGWYCTNDMFTVDEDGWYEHQGRSDDMLKISGQWVSPAEIEEQVLLHPKVDQAAVVGVANEDGLVRLALFMVAPEVQGDQDVFESELQKQIVDKLSIYKCPRRMFYLDDMPMTATGKLQRFALREIAERSM